MKLKKVLYQLTEWLSNPMSTLKNSKNETYSIYAGKLSYDDENMKAEFFWIYGYGAACFLFNVVQEMKEKTETSTENSTIPHSFSVN